MNPVTATIPLKNSLRVQAGQGSLVGPSIEVNMLGALSIGKKAAQYGYKKFGVPGAVLAGAGGAAGYAAFKKKTKSAVKDELDEDDQNDGGRPSDEHLSRTP